MVEKFKNILEEIERTYGKVYLFAVLQMDEFLDKWSIIISAPWITTENRKDIFEKIRHLIVQKLSSEEINSIARIGFHTLESHLIKELLKRKKGSKIEEDEQINGNVIHKGHILESNPDLDSSA